MSTASSPSTSQGWHWEHSFAQLPGSLHQNWKLTPVKAPRLVVFNQSLAEALGLCSEQLQEEPNAALFAGHTLPPGAKPLVQAYAGHQFGHFTTLGDGRALLLGEHLDPTQQRWDIQLKGSGPTPFSRGGDGRAALGPMLREFLLSEAMHALRIPTTRSLAVALTGETVFRNDGPLPGAVLTRVAASHLRVGTFEWAALREHPTTGKALLTYTLTRHFPDRAHTPNPALALLEAVLERQASLVARWMLVGFIHGVLNTDNVALSGETIDYGPCAFLDRYAPNTAFSSIDVNGRYAFANQPRITQWNLARFAETLLPLWTSDDPNASEALESASALIHDFPKRYETFWLAELRAKLGLFTQEPEDALLGNRLLDWMERHQADFTNTFRSLSSLQALQAAPFQDPDFGPWYTDWKNRLTRQPQSALEIIHLMRAHNPAIIPRNHLVEEALSRAVTHQDLSPLHALLDALRSPYAPPQDLPPHWLQPAPPDAPVYRTFCGT